MPTAREVTVLQLHRARELVRRGWTQGVFARDVQDGGVEPTAKGAVSYCAGGAICSVVGHYGPCSPLEYLAAALPTPCMPIYESLAIYNDASTTTQADILACYDRAICMATKPLF